MKNKTEEITNSQIDPNQSITLTLSELQALVQFEKLASLVQGINQKIQSQLNDNS